MFWRYVVSVVGAFFVVFACVAVPLNACAEDQKKAGASEKDAGKEKEAPSKSSPKLEKPSITHHELLINGKHFKYTAQAGELLVEAEGSELKGKYFYIAYTLDTPKGSAPRPITFAFNGGPGASSVWLNLGAMGPRRVVLSEDGTVLPPPAQLVPNKESWLPFTDMVFVDPVGTGYSRGANNKPKENKAFWGVEQDLEYGAEFIRLYLTRNERWLSPKFLVGESYGGTRVAALSSKLQRSYGMRLNGVVLISPALDFESFQGDGILPYVLYLPSFAATAWYQGERQEGKKTNRGLPKLLAEVEQYSLDTYLPSLAYGDALASGKTTQMVETVAAYTGLSKDFVALHDSMVHPMDFFQELLRNKRLYVGRMDGTVTGINRNPEEDSYEYDPSLAKLGGVFPTAMNAYVREELKYKNDLSYEFLNGEVNRHWNWGIRQAGSQGYLETSKFLDSAMSSNEYMGLFVACGLYDMATPYFATLYSLRQMGLDPRLKKNVELVKYPAGHMMFTHTDSRKALTRDVRGFYEKLLPEIVQ